MTAEEWALQPPKEYPEASAVVILDKGSLEVSVEGITFTYYKRIKILRKAGSEGATQAEIAFYEKDRIINPEAQTIAPDGRIVKAQKKDILTREASNRRTITIPFPAVEDGCIVEFRYEQRHRRYNILDPWYFQDDLFTLKSEFKLVLIGRFTYNASYENTPPECRYPKKEGAGIFRWEMTNIAPVEAEPYMAAPRSYRASLHCQLVSYRDAHNDIRFIENWSDLGDKFQQTVDGFTSKRGDLPGLAASVCQGFSTPLEIVKCLYGYVKDTIETRDEDRSTYFIHKSIQDLVRFKSGSTDEKNLLLVELVRASSIPAHPILIATRDYAVFNPEIFHINQFNRILCHVEIDGRTYVLDARDKMVPFPYVPPADLVGRGLLLKGKESAPVEFDHFRRPSGLDIASRLWLQRDGSAVCSTHVMVQGYFRSKYNPLLSGKPTEEEIRDLLLRDNAANFRIVSADSVVQGDADSAWFDVVLALPAFGTVSSGRIFFRPLAFWYKSPQFTKAVRSFPVDFNYPFMVSDHTEVNLGEGLELAESFDDISIKIVSAYFSRTTLKSGNSATILSGLYVSQPIVLPAYYPDLKGMFDRTVQAGAEEMSAVIK